MTVMMPAPKRVFLGIPTYDGNVRIDTMRSVAKSSKIRQVTWRHQQGSLLAMVFNSLFVQALESGCDHFVMLHADIAPHDDWIDTLIEEMESTGADVISAVSPIKDYRGLTSTSVDRGTPEDSWLHRRLTMSELMELPETFSTDDIPWSDGKALLINTGCWACNLRRPWVKKFTGFSINDKITHSKCEACDGAGCDQCGNHGWKAKVHVESEDWAFGRWLHANRCRVYATRKVSLLHFGGTVFTNTKAWGEWKEDLHNVTKPELAEVQ